MTTWIVLRAAGVAAYVAFFLSVAWGLVSSTSLITKRISKPTSTAFHATVGMPQCIGILGNFMPMDNPVVVGKSYTNINMTCGVLCGTA